MSPVVGHRHENIVYLLGAGFSRPLGLPLVSDFLEKARDQYAVEPKQYAHFRHVFQRINQLARVRSAYHAALHNIEEVLSLVEMQDTLGGRRGSRRLQEFICDVIEYYTPSFALRPDIRSMAWPNAIRNGAPSVERYLRFVGCLFGYEFSGTRAQTGSPLGSGSVHCQCSAEASYSVITLNYDRVLELCANYFSSLVPAAPGFEQSAAPVGQALRLGVVPLAKLHGDVATRKVIPPTWNKGTQTTAWPAWRLAHSVLRTATQIRVIGYSLADSDTYVRYLLKTAALESDRLKRFDVLCLDDSSKGTETRYRAFVEMPQLRFKSASVDVLLDSLPNPDATPDSTRGHVVHYRGLEAVHDRLMELG